MKEARRVIIRFHDRKCEMTKIPLIICQEIPKLSRLILTSIWVSCSKFHAILKRFDSSKYINISPTSSLMEEP